VGEGVTLEELDGLYRPKPDEKWRFLAWRFGFVRKVIKPEKQKVAAALSSRG